VAFDIDADGILHVSAKDLATQKEQKIRITASSGLSEDEVGRMVDEAKKHETEDRRVKELIDARNQADTLVYSVEKNLKDFGDKVPAEERKAIEEAAEKLKRSMKGNDRETIMKDIDTLQKASYKLAEEMYAKAGTAGEPHASGPGPAQESKPGGESEKTGEADTGAVDADYEVIDEDEEE
jgi:molecular chaperone DnaK